MVISRDQGHLWGVGAGLAAPHSGQSHQGLGTGYRNGATGVLLPQECCEGLLG